uniref:Protein tyrosine phosphatase receptor type N n=1 Tax=Podarcis muralis TaxID=64176 RepID=A0A670JNK3_PODMU
CVSVTLFPGCLFDRRLCSQQEVCVQDGLFGQCQEGSLRDKPYFQVTASVLQRLQDVLRHLMAQGLSWQDDLTQHVISREMERIPRLHLPPPWESKPTNSLLNPICLNAQKLILHCTFVFLHCTKWVWLHVRTNSAALCREHFKIAFLFPCVQFSYPDGTFRDNPNAHSAEHPVLLDRAAASKSLFGASTAPSYRGQQGLDGGQLFQDLGALYLTQEQTGKSRTMAPQDPHPCCSLLSQPRSLGAGGAAVATPSPFPNFPSTDRALERLAAVLASYGIRPQDLTPRHLSSLTGLLRLLRSPGKIGKMVYVRGSGRRGSWDELEPPPSQESYVSAVPTEGQVQAQREMLSPTKAKITMTTASPEQPEPLQATCFVGVYCARMESGHLVTSNLSPCSVVGPALTFRIRQNHQNLSLGDVANRAALVKPQLETEVGVKILQTGVGQRNEAATFPHPTHFGDTFRSVLLTFVLLACVAGIVIAAAVVFCLRQHAKQREKERLAGLGPEGAADSTFEYQELCRQHMAAKSLFGRAEAPSPSAPAENSRVSSVSSQFSDAPQASPSSHSSTPSWCEEPVQSNMDISTGHMILAYMEDHLRNRDRLAKEWQALCAYQAEPNACEAAQREANIKKNRNPDYVPYDHARIKLKAESNPSRSDFINASPIIDHDPRMPAYIATQGPPSHTIADFWQMVWENGCTVIVMLSPLVEDGVKQCDRYWPDEGSSLYHIYEVNLVSEHIWCEDFLVRSFYLKNVQSQETRTLTQFHFLSWPAEGIPTTTRPLLDFRRKVNKCYRGRSCPIVIHCSDGAGRTGTYILIDMVLNRMAKGVKEIDIAATLEHVRDQRPGMVQTKDQFEFALTAVAEEVNAILKALPQ